MLRVSHIVLVRHGETVGESSTRYHGRNDVVLSRAGRNQARALKETLALEVDRVIASPLARAWQTATILAPGLNIEIEEAFAEIDFGRWEGLSQEEIVACDPDLFQVWQSGVPEFEFPEGENKEAFRTRIQQGLKRVLSLEARSLLVVAHKGVVRGLAEGLTGQALPEAIPDLGQALEFRRGADESWVLKEGASPDRVPSEAPVD
jgi:broad specificity phosphatase PhoE